MKPALLAMLYCPHCQSGFQVTQISAQENDAVLEGDLACACRSVPVVRGIPRFVSSDSYAENFGNEWTRFHQTQLDSNTGSGKTRATFVEKTGWQPESLTAEDTVLEVGCGAGRFLEIIGHSPATIVGVDLTRAIDVSRQNTAHLPNVHLVQADVYDLPFRPESFSHVYSIGVLHHTPSTYKAFTFLPPLVKAGGQLAVWVYRRWPFTPKTLTHFVRLFTHSMPEDRLLQFCALLDRVWYPVVKCVKLGKYYPLRFLLMVSVYPNREWRILNNFDAYSPRYNHQHTRGEVMGWFRKLGFTQVESLGASTAIRGQKPQAQTSVTPKQMERV